MPPATPYSRPASVLAFLVAAAPVPIVAPATAVVALALALALAHAAASGLPLEDLLLPTWPLDSAQTKYY